MMETLTLLIITAAISGAAAWFAGMYLNKKRQSATDEQQFRLEASLNLEKEKSFMLGKENENLKAELKEERRKGNDLSIDLTKIQTEYLALKEKLAEQKLELEDLHKRFSLEFKNLANEILEEKSKKFTDQNKLNLTELLEPFRQRIIEFQKKVEDTNTQSAQRNSALSEQLKSLRELNQQITQEARSLTMALKGDSKAQGGWGEMQLESILEKAGLQRDVHYSREKNYKNEEGSNQRLDFIIHLPDGKHLILDAKVSLTAYSRYFDCDEEEDRKKCLKQHLESLYGHIRGLGDKNYQSLYNINPPDYVMMFIANEPALTIALKEDQLLYEKALEKNIVLVSTTTLLATLRTISYIWKQDLQNKNAEEIARQAGSLYDKFVSFSEDLLKIGGQLNTVQKTYQESMKKLTDGKDNLIRKTERIRELGAKTSKTADQRLLDRSS